MNNTINILHLTDYHFSSDSQYTLKQNVYIEKLLGAISSLDKPDIFIFSGDLVWSGSLQRDFLGAHKSLIIPVLEKLDIKAGNFFICPGNHDVDRSKCYIPISTHIESTIDNNEKLNSFVKNLKSKEVIDSLAHLQPYFEYVDKELRPIVVQEGDEYNQMYSVHKRTYAQKKIGIVTINTAWRSIDWGDEDESGNLLFPTTLLEQAILSVKECDFKVLVMHHPIKFLRGFNEWVVEDIVYEHFDLLLSGHEHKPRASMTPSNSGGLVHIAGGATVAGNDSIISGSLISWNTEKSIVKCRNIILDKQLMNTYLQAEQVLQFPVNDIKRKANRLRSIIAKKCKEEMENANSLFVSSFEEDKGKNFLSLFTEPVLTTRNSGAIGESPSEATHISVDNILLSSENYVILGKDKSGKSSLLKKLQIEILASYKDTGRIAYYIDAADSSNSRQGHDLTRRIRDYLGINEKETRLLLASGRFMLLIDNHSRENTRENEQIRKLILDYPKIRIIICAPYSTSKMLETYEIDHIRATKLYLCDITKHQIRQLANKWPNIRKEKKDDVVEKIYRISKQLGIPFNYWSVSLLLWVFERTSDANYHNSMDIVNLYIDSILDKERLALDRNPTFSFNNYKEFLAHLAVYLLKEHAERGYRATMSEIVSFIEKYIERNIRFVAEPQKIWDYITDRGILARKGGSLFTFRLRGVFEYFIGYYMSLNPSHLFENVLSENSLYLSYTNEIEFYAGLNRRDQKLLEILKERANQHFSVGRAKYVSGEITLDGLLQSKVIEAYDITEHVRTIIGNEPLAPEERDSIELAAEGGLVEQDIEVTVKEVFEISDTINSTILEKSLFVYSRAFRNLDGIEDSGLTLNVLKDLIELACIWGFTLLDEVIAEVVSEDELLENGKKILAMIANYVPIIAQVYLSDAVGHITLAKMVRNLIEEYESSPEENQYRLFILNFLLIDLDPYHYREELKKLMTQTKSKVLQSAILLKLHFFLAFKSHDRPELEKFMKDAILEQTHRVYPNQDLQKVESDISKKARIARLRNKGLK